MTGDDELLALAEKALSLRPKTPGHDPQHVTYYGERDATFFRAACSPERIISLVRRCQEAERALAEERLTRRLEGDACRLARG